MTTDPLTLAARLEAEARQVNVVSIPGARGGKHPLQVKRRERVTALREAAAAIRTLVEEQACYCGYPRVAHCDLDEPGVDHPLGCEKKHHEFKPTVRRGEEVE